MDLFVVDASVTMAWCFEDEDSGYADRVLEMFKTATAVVPSVWTLEVVNVLLVAERRDRLRKADSIRFLALVEELPIQVDNSPRPFRDILSLGRDQDLSSYDAAYLDLAMRHGAPLATLDSRLRGAAEACSVPLVEKRGRRS